MSGVFLLWQGHAQESPDLLPAPAKAASSAISPLKPIDAPESTPKSREQKRFDRADKDNDGKIRLAELLQPRQKAYAKLDTNRDGKLSFEEWAVTTIDKFKGADSNSDGLLTRAEYATTAPKPKPKPRCGC
jgi:hypothetical protein